ncbi:MAG: hypothetical protein MJ185_11225 [Treponema sp.]|nr:hypothetical protein [Treponema sp.]
MTENQLKKEIFSRYGAVTRARGCFLYTKKGVRLTDLYQADGRAILGWGGGDAFTKLKNILNRGITGSFVTEYDNQIDKAVSELLQSNRHVVFTYCAPEYVPFWEPWNENHPALSEIARLDSVTIKPPLPWTDSLYLVCVKPDSDDDRIPGKIDVPSPLIAAVTRSLYDLIKAMKEREEKNWFIYDQSLIKFFERQGPYLYPKISEDEYDDFVLFCLDNGVVINPDYNEHSIVPFGADKGVFTKLKNDERGLKYAAD